MKIGTSASKRKKLEANLHKIIRDICIKENPHCVICGSTDILQGGHLIPARASKAVRFDLMNVFTQCRPCNGLHRFNQSRYIQWFINKYGIDEYNNLIGRSKPTKNWKIWELEEMITNYKELLESSVIELDVKKAYIGSSHKSNKVTN